MEDQTSLLLGIVFSGIGVGYFLYGKRQQHLVSLLCGLLLMGFTYFVSDLWVTLAIGLGAMALPFLLRA
ncbi:hypothetical protein [Pseudomonas sp. RIT-PI-AD]|uniref:hypothetical protein n=1 Tax=Pseudomonas sp. RIT-PI-AD TaxID=3035294 RepID=UPI0021D8C7A6|nr:hypothetical protein [Pseudomonas sp. RIT-PI-AD]